jgi:hypothetical protein
VGESRAGTLAAQLDVKEVSTDGSSEEQIAERIHQFLAGAAEAPWVFSADDARRTARRRPLLVAVAHRTVTTLVATAVFSIVTWRDVRHPRDRRPLEDRGPVRTYLPSGLSGQINGGTHWTFPGFRAVVRSGQTIRNVYVA